MKYFTLSLTCFALLTQSYAYTQDDVNATVQTPASELSAGEQEALAAEEAELREAGVTEEPNPE